MILQKAAGCWWFGVEGRCNVYTVLQVVSWILTIVDLCVASLINITSMSISNMSPKMVKRSAFSVILMLLSVSGTLAECQGSFYEVPTQYTTKKICDLGCMQWLHNMQQVQIANAL